MEKGIGKGVYWVAKCLGLEFAYGYESFKMRICVIPYIAKLRRGVLFHALENVFRGLLYNHIILICNFIEIKIFLGGILKFKVYKRK